MVKIITLSLIFFSASYISAQTLYEVTELGSQYSQAQIDQAFGSADFCGYVRSSARAEIILNDGTKIELLPISEQPNLDSSCAQADDFVFPDATWKISSTGIVLRQLSGLYVK